MDYLKKFLTAEYAKGNYIVIAGDWNQCPPGLKTVIPGFQFDEEDYMPINADFMPEDWTWIYRNDVPTNRRVIAPYDKATTLTTIIDAFLISPNVENISIENINLEFEHSDHHPIKASFKLIE
jgi:exonuclease III